MTKKRFFLLIVFAFAFIATTHLASAQGGIVDVYVDSSRTDANEDGSKTNPYNSEKEGKAYLQAQQNGGYLYVRKADGTWSAATPIASTISGASGTPITDLTFYILLTVLTLILIWVGWQLIRRSRRMQT